MSESRVRENRMHGSMRRREATNASRARTRRAAAEASRRPYGPLVRAPTRHTLASPRRKRSSERGRSALSSLVHGGGQQFLIARSGARDILTH
jgi:hypothetical protein